jgi:hypothetical protein
MANYRFTIALSASVPSAKRSEKYQELYRRVPYAQIQVDEAVISLARNVFQAGGRLVFGGHPSISPLVTTVATEFPINRDVEDSKRNEFDGTPVTIYQSEAHANGIAPQNSLLFNSGYARVAWTPAVDNEQYNPALSGTRQCLKSLTTMRKQMLSGNIDALVCVGGMEGVEEEFEIFRAQQLGRPIFLLASTGGATQILSNRYREFDNVYVYANDSIELPQAESKKNDKIEKSIDLIPFSFQAALIVRRILSNR